MDTTELRSFGDGTTIVLYTEDKRVYHQLKEWAYCQRVVLYKRGNKMVAADLYFSKEAERGLRKALRLPAKTKRKATPRQPEASAAGRMKSPAYHRNRGPSRKGVQAQG